MPNSVLPQPDDSASSAQSSTALAQSEDHHISAELNAKHSVSAAKNLAKPALSSVRSAKEQKLLDLAISAALMTKLYPMSRADRTELFEQYWQLLRQNPPLVPIEEVMALRAELAQLHDQDGQILHMGDCVEVLAECTPSQFAAKLKAIGTIRDTISLKTKAPTVAIARMAGQFAKPRSSFYEQGQTGDVHSFMGEMINGASIDQWSRTPSLERLLWAQDAARHGLKAMAADPRRRIYASHEALHLLYDGAQTIPVDKAIAGGGKRLVNSSTHLPWIGMRTTYQGSPHLRYLQDLINPVGIKIGPETTPAAIEEALHKGNPYHEHGKLIFITRLGAGRAKNVLGGHIETVRRLGGLGQVLWIIDPMHGNTRKNSKGLKYRALSEIAAEIDETLEVHRSQGTRNSGLHLESSANDIYECCHTLADSGSVVPGARYTSLCDPRLNFDQAMAIVHHYLEQLKR